MAHATYQFNGPVTSGHIGSVPRTVTFNNISSTVFSQSMDDVYLQGTAIQMDIEGTKYGPGDKINVKDGKVYVDDVLQGSHPEPSTTRSYNIQITATHVASITTAGPVTVNGNCGQITTGADVHVMGKVTGSIVAGCDVYT